MPRVTSVTIPSAFFIPTELTVCGAKGNALINLRGNKTISAEKTKRKPPVNSPRINLRHVLFWLVPKLDESECLFNPGNQPINVHWWIDWRAAFVLTDNNENLGTIQARNQSELGMSRKTYLLSSYFRGYFSGGNLGLPVKGPPILWGEGRLSYICHYFQKKIMNSRKVCSWAQTEGLNTKWILMRQVILIKLFLSLSLPPVFEFKNCVLPETTAHRRFGSGLP